jgi:hypothetical protein
LDIDPPNPFFATSSQNNYAIRNTGDGGRLDDGIFKRPYQLTIFGIEAISHREDALCTVAGKDMPAKHQRVVDVRLLPLFHTWRAELPEQPQWRLELRIWHLVGLLFVDTKHRGRSHAQIITFLVPIVFNTLAA